LFGQPGRHNNVTGSGGVGTNGNINLFANPEKVFNSLGTPLPGVVGRPDAENLNEPRTWNVDLSVGKNLLVTERYRMLLSIDAFNVFNHPLFGTNATAGTVSLDLSDPAGFGVMSAADNSPRSIQIGLRFEF
jgi:hypothetical protein